MDLLDAQALLRADVEDFLLSLYRQCKITETAQINFLAGRSGISVDRAQEIAAKLEQMGFIRFGKYGSVSWTPSGKEYAAGLAKHKEICYTVRR